jgi:hypothetical protein
MAIVANNTTRGGSVTMNSQTSSTRTTNQSSFGTLVRNGVATGAGAAAGAATVAAPFVPGGAAITAAVNGGAQAAGFGGAAQGTQDVPGMGPGLNGAGGQAGGAAGGASGSMMDQAKQMQEMQMSFSMQYLTLQEKMQNENRQYTTVSNVLKTKHDTVKNSINNVR